MISQAVQDAIEQVTATAIFGGLFDHLADDIELRVAIAVGSPGYSEHRGKRSVISYLQNVGDADAPRIDEPLDFFASGDRIVAFRDECFAIGTGLMAKRLIVAARLALRAHLRCRSRWRRS